MGSFLNAFEGLKVSRQILTALCKNQSIITNNIANVDTPEYVRKGSNFEQVMGSLRSPIETSLAKEMGPSPLLDKDGGKVSLETELTEMNRNYIQYNMVLRRTGSLLNEIKNAAQVGR